MGAMASEPVRVHNYLHADDTISTLNAMRSLGALVEEREDELVIRGVGLREARVPEDVIDVGNAGTLMRLLPGWLAAQDGNSYTLDGDKVWYDLSDVFGDAFAGKKLVEKSAAPTCPQIVWPNGVSPGGTMVLNTTSAPCASERLKFTYWLVKVTSLNRN